MVARIKFTNEINNLVNSVLIMSARLEKTIDTVIKNLDDKNEYLAKQIVENDDIFDKDEHDIEKKCLKLVLTQSPVASDWRKIVAIMKMISDIERIGDHCADISKYTMHLATEHSVELPKYFHDMLDVIRNMVHNSIICFNDSDTVLAEKIIKTDDIVDKYFYDFRKDIEVLIEQNPKDTEQYINYLMIAKYVERIADHTTNIAEWVIFIVKNELK